jgi:hypothetical protein
LSKIIFPNAYTVRFSITTGLSSEIPKDPVIMPIVLIIRLKKTVFLNLSIILITFTLFNRKKLSSKSIYVNLPEDLSAETLGAIVAHDVEYWFYASV